MAQDWLQLLFKLPREPSAARVYTWRKLKQLGALLLYDAAWVLPASERNREQFQWLASEIVEMHGDATLAQLRLLDRQGERQLVARFQEQVDDLYRNLLADAKKPKHDLTALSRRFQQAQAVDFFHSSLAARVRKTLLALGGE